MAETISITICGDGGCGKSSITLRLVRSQWTHEYDPTIEDSYSVTRTVDGLPYFLSLTDTAGQEEYRGLWAAANLKSDAFLLVYDITNAASLETLGHFMEMIDLEAENRGENNVRLIRDHGGASTSSGERMVVGMAPPVKFVAGNKCDLKDERTVTARQGLEWARKRGCGFMETSAREMVNIEETFALIVRRVVEARRLHREQQFSQVDQLSIPAHISPKSSSQRLFPASLLKAAQPISHSRTPALTPEERGISDSDPDQDDNGKSRPEQGSPLSGLGRAVSKRVARLKKRSTTAMRRGSVQHDQSAATATAAATTATTSRAIGEENVQTTQRSKSVPNEKNRLSIPQFPARNGSVQEGNSPIKGPWWRRIRC